MGSCPIDCTGVKQYNISDLPPEILPNIFKFLTTSERKAVKLVNRLWFENCNTFISNTEVLNCLGIYKLADIYELLSKSKRKFLNLKFDFVDFPDDASFWHNNGSRIRSITLKDCQFSSGIDEIIVSCQNLIDLSFVYTRVHTYNGQGFIHLRLINNFKRLLENKIVRKNVSSLKINIDYNTHTSVYLTDQCICALLSIFPKLKILKINLQQNFRFNFQRLDDLRTDFSNPCKVSDTDFTFSPVLNYLIANKGQIEKLRICFRRSSPRPAPRTLKSVRCILEVLSSMSRLKELTLDLGFCAALLEDLDQIFRSKPLKSLSLTRGYRGSFSLESLLINNPQLEHLSIWNASPEIAKKPLLERLMSSGVKCCKITLILYSTLMGDLDSFRSEFTVQMRPKILPNLSVDIIRAAGPGEGRVEMVHFLRNAQNMLHLKLDNGSFEELQTVMEYQKKLKSLIMCDEDGYRLSLPEEYVDVFRNSFYHLTDLEHLALGYSMTKLFLSSVSPGSTILKNLKYLKLDRLSFAVDEMIPPTDILRLADVAPCLEGLFIDYGKAFSIDISVQLCSKLSRLQFLRLSAYDISDDDIYSDEDYRKIFTVCPSLRVLCYCIFVVWPDSPKSDVYFFDTINQKVIPILQHAPYLSRGDNHYYCPMLQTVDYKSSLYTFAKPRIARYTVDWLKF